MWTMRRREFVAALGSAAIISPRSVQAQGRIYRVGALSAGPPLAPTSPRGAIFLAGLSQRGYRIGQNLTFEARGSFGKNESMPQLAEELKAAHVEAILTIGFPSALAAKNTGIPTVLASGSGDPVSTGLIQSLARPGGNVTGIADDAATLSTKRLSLLKATVPQLRRVAMLWNSGDLAMSQRQDAAAKAAQSMGVQVQPVGIPSPDAFKDAFASIAQDKPDAILMVSDSLTLGNRKLIIDFAAEHRIPAIYEADSIVRDGGLMSYGAADSESFDRAAAMIDLILKGAKPGELPVEQPTRFLFVINLKTAKSIGLDIPPTAAALADEILE